MPKHQFTVKPAILPALVPHLLFWLWRFLVAGALVYGVLYALAQLGVHGADLSGLLLSVITGVVVGTIITNKHRLLRLHNTKYTFYDTHVVRETKLFASKRQSIPYTHISKVTNNSNLWQRIIGVSDLVLHSMTDEENDVVIAYVKNPDELEHKIYKLLKNAKKKDE